MTLREDLLTLRNQLLENKIARSHLLYYTPEGKLDCACLAGHVGLATVPGFAERDEDNPQQQLVAWLDLAILNSEELLYNQLRNNPRANAVMQALAEAIREKNPNRFKSGTEEAMSIVYRWNDSIDEDILLDEIQTSVRSKEDYLEILDAAIVKTS